MKKVFLFIILLLTTFFSQTFGQTTKEEVLEDVRKTAGVHFAYPFDNNIKYTSPPNDYEPFYISHFGRHGSRYLISDNEYKDIIDLLVNAKMNNALTSLGEDVLERLKLVWDEVEFRGGDLSPLGLSEHQGIADRMYQAYSPIFEGNSNISACATTIVRCVLSMDAFCERLKELNPSLSISRNSGMKWQRYLNHHTKEAIAYRSSKDTWREEYRKFEKAHVRPDRLVNSLFSDSTYILRKANPENIMWSLFSIAGGMQNIETQVSFYDLFEKEELFDLWQCKNYQLYVNNANYALNGGIMMENCKPLLEDIINRAEEVITSNNKGADLRFAHDGNIIPLAMLLHLDECYNSVSQSTEFYKAWSDFKIAPMAGNIQIVFYRNKPSNNVIVKFLLHENEVLIPPVKSDILPYYHWDDVKTFYNSLLDHNYNQN